MKALQFFAITTLVLWAAAASAQLVNDRVSVYTLKAFCQKIGEEAFSEWEDVSEGVFVVFDNQKDILKIHNEAGSTFKIGRQVDEGVDQDGDAYSRFSAIDEEGIPCSLFLLREEEYLHIYAEYPNLTLGFLVQTDF